MRATLWSALNYLLLHRFQGWKYFQAIALVTKRLNFKYKGLEKWIKGYSVINNKYEIHVRNEQCFWSSEGKITMKNL